LSARGCRAEQGGRYSFKGDGLEFCADGLAGALIQLFGGPGGVLGGVDIDEAVVLAHEERVEPR